MLKNAADDIIQSKVWIDSMGKRGGSVGAIEVSKSEIKQYQKLKLISEIALVKEHIRFFEQKYGCGFEEFEAHVKQEEEHYEKWDDYLEWKAYQRSLEGLRKTIGEIDGARDIRITE